MGNCRNPRPRNKCVAIIDEWFRANFERPAGYRSMRRLKGDNERPVFVDFKRVAPHYEVTINLSTCVVSHFAQNGLILFGHVTGPFSRQPPARPFNAAFGRRLIEDLTCIELADEDRAGSSDRVRM